MRQVILSNIWEDFGNNYIVALWMNSTTGQAGSAEHLVSIAWPVAGTFQNLTVRGDLTGSTWTLFVNDVASTLTGTTAGGVCQDTTHTVSVVEGDRVYYKRTGGDWFYANNPPIGMAIEFESPTMTTSAYGFSPTPNNSSGATSAAAGALGSYGLSGTIGACNTVSLCPIAGTITRNTVFFEATSTDATKGYRSTIAKNGVLQDGSGGTSDTRAVAMATSTAWQYTSVACGVAVVAGDRIEHILESINSVNMASGASLVFEATTAGQFAICGSNQTSSGPGGPYAAIPVYGSMPGRWGLGEDGTNKGVMNIGSVTSYMLTGLQWFYIGPYPNAGPDVWTVQKNGSIPSDTPTLSMVLNDTYEIDSNASHLVQIDDGDEWTTRADAASAPSAVQAHWSFAAYAASAVPPSPPTDTAVYAARRLRQFSLPTTPENRWVFLKRLEFLLETGRGLTTGQGSDPQIMIQISRDYGHTWGNELWIAAGAIGEYAKRAFLQRLGRIRSGGVVRLVVSDPIPWTFLSALADFDEGSS